MENLTAQEAQFQISEMFLELNENPVNEALLNFEIQKLVANILSYCHLELFPLPLIFDCVDLLLKKSLAQSSENSISENAPLSKIKMDDTEFDFAVNAVNFYDDNFFESLKPKLNLYRRLIKW